MPLDISGSDPTRHCCSAMSPNDQAGYLHGLPGASVQQREQPQIN